jgi:hypothetical protein
LLASSVNTLDVLQNIPGSSFSSASWVSFFFNNFQTVNGERYYAVVKAVSGSVWTRFAQGDADNPQTRFPRQQGYPSGNWNSTTTSTRRLLFKVLSTGGGGGSGFTVTYDGNGNTSGTAPVDGNSPYQSGSQVTVLGQGTLTRTNYTFLGWSDINQSPTVDYPVGSTFIIAQNIMLYAVWSSGLTQPLIVAYNGNGSTGGTVPGPSGPYPSGALVTVLDNTGNLIKPGHTFLGWSPNSVATSPTYTAGSTFNIQNNSVILYAIWGVTTGTIVVPRNGLYTGQGSKQTVIEYNGTDVIMQVEANVPGGYFNESAIIENLVIDGNNAPDSVGILLENVYGCYIRNLTIMNCAVGIKVKITGNNWSHANRFEHIRMIDVKTGILFEGTNTNNDFSYTTIDSVLISLKNNSTDIGIKIGKPYANLYSAFIKSTVWLATSGATGMEVNGSLKFSLVNFEVEQNSDYNGKGVVISSGATVYDNQSFLLTALGLKSGDPPTIPDNRVVANVGSFYDGKIKVVPP